MVEIGKIIGEFSGGSDLCAYVHVEAVVDGQPVRVATMIGVRESDRDTCRKAFGDVRPFLRTWWADSSDFDQVPRRLVDDVEGALADAAPRLWAEREQRHERARIGRVA